VREEAFEIMQKSQPMYLIGEKERVVKNRYVALKKVPNGVVTGKRIESKIA
jgi:hypothetical protein